MSLLLHGLDLIEVSVDESSKGTVCQRFSPELCSDPSSRPILSQAEFRRASGQRSGSDHGSRYQFRRVLSGMPPCFTFSPEPVFAGLA